MVAACCFSFASVANGSVAPVTFEIVSAPFASRPIACFWAAVNGLSLVVWKTAKPDEPL